ncbi:MAG TPA: GlsB/YeaQ/YmgE family stress response membrane protein [Mycobacterium sp.]|nr:GlsB/YeaQ/YmgE family stress response membrane protein [Mycobacterium sp.]
MTVMAATEFLARSSTLTSVGWIGYIIIGGLAGALASRIIRGSGAGIVMDIVIGIVGALIGGFILSFFVNTAGGGIIFTFITALIGALLLLWIVGMVRRRT